MKGQQTITQMREKGKTPENKLSDKEILSLQEKDFRLLIIKMMQDIGNKLEAKMDNLQETLSKEIQNIKLKQEEMQNRITEIKNSLEAANSRIQEAEERISEVENRLVEIIDGEQNREKRLKTNEESLRELWDNVKCTNICIIGVSEEKREKGTENIFQEIIAENIPNTGKEPPTQIQEAKQVPYKLNPRRNTPRHILIKLTRIKDKEKILKAAWEKKQVTYKEIPIMLLADFSAETLQARREWHDIFNMMKGKKLPTKITLPSKAPVQI